MNIAVPEARKILDKLVSGGGNGVFERDPQGLFCKFDAIKIRKMGNADVRLSFFFCGEEIVFTELLNTQYFPDNLILNIDRMDARLRIEIS